MSPQPSEETEIENAAYMLLVSVQADLAEEARASSASSSTHDKICWAFERYQRAYMRHKALEDARLEKRK